MASLSVGYRARWRSRESIGRRARTDHGILASRGIILALNSSIQNLLIQGHHPSQLPKHCFLEKRTPSYSLTAAATTPGPLRSTTRSTRTSTTEMLPRGTSSSSDSMTRQLRGHTCERPTPPRLASGKLRAWLRYPRSTRMLHPWPKPKPSRRSAQPTSESTKGSRPW